LAAIESGRVCGSKWELFALHSPIGVKGTKVECDARNANDIGAIKHLHFNEVMVQCNDLNVSIMY